MTLQRDWTAARAKVDWALGCTSCGYNGPLEAAHVMGRKYDRRVGVKVFVDPDSIVALCGDCHRAYDAYRLDLLPHLGREEQARAVLDVGLFAAFRRITGRRSLDCGCFHEPDDHDDDPA